MTKAEIIMEISNKTDIERAKVETIIEAFATSVKEHLIQKENISLRRFGNFTIKRRGAKVARNISKGTSINLPPYYTPTFKPSKEFKKALRSMK